MEMRVRWFESLTVRDIQGIDMIIPALGTMLSSNVTLKSLKVQKIKTIAKVVQHPSPQIQTLSCLINAFKKNPDSGLESLTLSDLPFTNEVIVALLPVIPSVTELSFAHCLMNQSVMVHFFQTLKECPGLTKKLQSLDIADNTLGPDGSAALAAWMNEAVPLNLSSINLAGTNPVWPVVITALQKREIIVRQLDISRNPIYDKVFCVLNPFIAGGHVVSLGVGDLKGDMIMTEGLCGSLLLNANLKATTLILDDTPMDCDSLETV